MIKRVMTPGLVSAVERQTISDVHGRPARVGRIEFDRAIVPDDPNDFEGLCKALEHVPTETLHLVIARRTSLNPLQFPRTKVQK